MSDALNGSCFCQQTRYTLRPTSPSGEAYLTLSAYCHCTQCQRMNGSPFVHTTHWKQPAVKWVTEPERFEQKPGKFKLRCRGCGSPVGTWSEKTSQYSIWPATLARDDQGRPIGLDEMKPTAHQYYKNRVMDIPDGLDKWEETVGKGRM